MVSLSMTEITHLKKQSSSKKSAQFIFLALIHKLQISAVIRSLKGNYIALYRNPKEILSQYKEALDEDILY